MNYEIAACGLFLFLWMLTVVWVNRQHADLRRTFNGIISSFNTRAASDADLQRLRREVEAEIQDRRGAWNSVRRDVINLAQRVADLETAHTAITENCRGSFASHQTDMAALATRLGSVEQITGELDTELFGCEECSDLTATLAQHQFALDNHTHPDLPKKGKKP